MDDLGLIGVWIGSLATFAFGYFVWTRDRPAAAIPFHRVLKASLKDRNPKHWVAVYLTPIPESDSTFKGVVVKITRQTVILDHPGEANQNIALTSIHRVQQFEQTWPLVEGWKPRLDQKRIPPTSRQFGRLLER